MVRSDVVDRFAQFGAVLGMLENFGPDIGEPQAARRTFEQADPELVLEVGNARAATAAEIAANFAVRQGNLRLAVSPGVTLLTACFEGQMVSTVN